MYYKFMCGVGGGENSARRDKDKREISKHDEGLHQTQQGEPYGTSATKRVGPSASIGGTRGCSLNGVYKMLQKTGAKMRLLIPHVAPLPELVATGLGMPLLSFAPEPCGVACRHVGG